MAISNVFCTSHNPLDPLTAEEIQETVRIIQLILPETLVFNWITLKEPEKHLLLPYFLQGTTPPPYSIPRKAFVILMERKHNIIQEIVVNLDAGKIETLEILPPDTQPAFSDHEHNYCVDIAKRDPRVQDRIRQLGFNISLVRASCWTVQSFDQPLVKTAIRPMYLFFYGRLFEQDNQYGKFD